MKRKDRPSIVQKFGIFLFLLGAVASVLIVFSLVRDYSMGLMLGGLGLFIEDIRAYLKERRGQDKQ